MPSRCSSRIARRVVASSTTKLFPRELATIVNTRTEFSPPPSFKLGLFTLDLIATKIIASIYIGPVEGERSRW